MDDTQRGQSWAPEIVEQLKILTSEGRSSQYIAEKLNKTAYTVRRRQVLLKLIPKEKLKGGPPIKVIWTPSQLATFKREWIKGTSIKAIANMVDKEIHQVKNKRMTEGMDRRRMEKTKKIQMRFPPDLYNKACRHASANGMTLSAYMKNILLRNLS